MKKLLISLIAICILTPSVFANSFEDVNGDQYFFNQIEELAILKLIDTDNTFFHPFQKITRAEAAQMLYAAVGGKDSLVCNIPENSEFYYEDGEYATFKDVTKTAWYFEAVECLYDREIISGYSHMPGYFGSNDPVTREEFAKMIVNAFKLPAENPSLATFDDVKTSMWSFQSIETAYKWGVVKGYEDGTYGPADKILRGDVAIMIFNAMYPDESV